MSDQMREEFIAWFGSINFYRPDSIHFGTILSFSDPKVEDAWLVWQASRAALCVELPNPSQAMKLVMNYQEHLRQNVTGTTNWAANLGMHVVDECRAAIESTGVRTK